MSESIFSSISPADLSLPARFDRFRQTQREALDWFQSSDSAVMAAQLPTGSGKTLFAAAAAALTGGKATYLVATKALQAQVLRDFEVSGMRDIRGRANYECTNYKNCDDGFDNECSRAQTDACPYTRAVTAAQQSLLPETNYAYWLYSQGVRNKAFEDTQLLICDECFPCDTLIDGKPIDCVREGDLVMSCNVPQSLFESKRVAGIMRRRPDRLVRVHFKDGRSIVCTPNHPFMCKYEGWKPAFDLESERVLRLRYATSNVPGPDSDPMLCVPDTDDTYVFESQVGLSQTRQSRVLAAMQGKAYTTSGNDTEAASRAPQAYVAEQPDEKPIGARENEDNAASDGLETNSTGREREGSDRAAALARLGFRVGDGIDSERETSKTGIPFSLQTGHRQPDTEDRRGSRRDVARFSYTQRTGSPENFLFDFIGVDCVEVLEQTSDGTFGGMCPDGFVYNIEVEDNHNYFADGILVHNCHAMENQLSSWASVKIYAKEMGKEHAYLTRDGLSGVMDNPLAPEAGSQSGKLFTWADAKAKELKDSDDEDEKDLYDRCFRITRMGSNWVWQFDDRGHVTFEPVRLSGFTSRLFAGVPRVLLMSASLSEFTLKLLLPPDLAYEYRAWPPVFPQDHAPVYHIPTVKLNWKSTDEDYKKVIERMDDIIRNRSDRKGIVHTVSYARSKRALLHSEFRDQFIWNDDGAGLQECLSRFRGSAARNSVLVTPSVEEGFDFPADACEYQIVLKFPFPNETQRVIKERCAQIPGYRLHYAAQKIVQMRGRPIRSYWDRAETFILDNSVKQLSGPEGRSYLPSGFRIFTVNTVPKAPPKIDPATIREE